MSIINIETEDTEHDLYFDECVVVISGSRKTYIETKWIRWLKTRKYTKYKQ